MQLAQGVVAHYLKFAGILPPRPLLAALLKQLPLPRNNDRSALPPPSSLARLLLGADRCPRARPGGRNNVLLISHPAATSRSGRRERVPFEVA
jgi:hypothetical protein